MPTLKELRKRSYLSQEELARAASIPRESISRYENGHKKPGHNTLTALANALKVEPKQIHFPRESCSEAAQESPKKATSNRQQLELFRLVIDNGIRDLLPEVPEQAIQRFFGKKRIIDYVAQIKSENQNNLTH
jgi:transcriptional regulator with XRE-family HTH domain